LETSIKEARVRFGMQSYLKEEEEKESEKGL
jgi:hypothetical protein